MNLTYKFNKTQLEELKKLLSYYTEIKLQKEGYQLFSVKIEGLNFTFYKSGKLLIQGTESEKNQLLLQSIQAIVLKTTKKDLLPLAGSDESGKGDVFGPLIVAATFVDEEAADKLKLLGVDDSKKFSHSKINELAPQIMQSVPFSIVRICCSCYSVWF
jgi:ribonuclease HIII